MTSTPVSTVGWPEIRGLAPVWMMTDEAVRLLCRRGRCAMRLADGFPERQRATPPDEMEVAS